jgi:hypothetical protein
LWALRQQQGLEVFNRGREVRFVEKTHRVVRPPSEVVLGQIVWAHTRIK